MTPHDKIRAVLKAATPGPWKHNPDFETIDSDHSPSGCVARIMFYNDTHRYDALLIANAPQWVAQLLDECDGLRARHAALVEVARAHLEASHNGSWEARKDKETAERMRALLEKEEK